MSCGRGWRCRWTDRRTQHRGAGDGYGADPCDGVGGRRISGERLRIGRLPDNDVVLDDLLVSRWHAELCRVDGRWHIRDLSSANGTYVNGQRVTEAAVEPDSVIGIGRSLLQLVDDRLVTYVDTGDVGFEARELVVTTRQGRLLDGVSFALGARSLLAVVGPQRLGQIHPAAGIDRLPPGGQWRGALQLLLVLINGGALMGAAASVRELVKERAIYRRERAIGLRDG